jgi:hypothetical protein
MLKANSECNEKQMYRINKHGDVVVNPNYIELWDLLTNNVGESINMGGLDTTTFFLPKVSQSTLRSTKSLTGPKSKVRLLVFEQIINYTPSPEDTEFRGPIGNQGYALNIFNNLLKYQVSWEILSSKPTIIGFYSSGDFQLGRTNQLYLISGSRGPAIFQESSGSFVFGGDMNMYVVVNREVNVEVKIEVIVPKRFFSPELTLGPYTKYFQLGQGDQVPIYRSFIRPDTYTIVTEPSCNFRNLYLLMLAYLEKTRLNLTLFADNLPQINPLSLMAGIDIKFLPQRHEDVPQSKGSGGGTSTIRTEGLTFSGGSTWGYGALAWEVSFVLAENLLQYKKFPLITLEVNVGPSTSGGGFKTSLTVKRFVNGSWTNHTDVDREHGTPKGSCVKTVYLEDLPYEFRESFLLDQEATDYNVTVYLSDYREVRYQLIKVEYVTVPYRG